MVIRTVTVGSAVEPASGPTEPKRAEPAEVFTRRERWEVGLIMAGILSATLLGFVAIFLVGRVYGILIGLGVLSYTLGLRHGVDADHICAIDNTTRKLLQQGKRPHTVGTWFSLGHSTVVMGMLVALVIAARWIVANLPSFESTGSLIGTAVSGGFLYLIAFINLLIFLEIYAIFRKLRAGALDAKALEVQLDQRGFMNRYFNFLFRFVNEPWQIYPIGVLFGLGFDTATEVALIAITVTVGTATSGFPLWMVLILPFMFTCGMVLVDTSDGDRDAIRLRLGVPQADPQGLLQPHDDDHLGPGRLHYRDDRAPRRPRSAELHLAGGPFGVWNSLGWLNGGVGTGASTSGGTSESPSSPCSWAVGSLRWRSIAGSATRRSGSGPLRGLPHRVRPDGRSLPTPWRGQGPESRGGRATEAPVPSFPAGCAGPGQLRVALGPRRGGGTDALGRRTARDFARTRTARSPSTGGSGTATPRAGPRRSAS